MTPKAGGVTSNSRPRIDTITPDNNPYRSLSDTAWASRRLRVIPAIWTSSSTITSWDHASRVVNLCRLPTSPRGSGAGEPPLGGEELIGATPVGLGERRGHDQQFVRVEAVGEFAQAAGDLRGCADEAGSAQVGDQLAVRLSPFMGVRLLRRGERGRSADAVPEVPQVVPVCRLPGRRVVGADDRGARGARGSVRRVGRLRNRPGR